jgi:carboxypeptidase Taq
MNNSAYLRLESRFRRMTALSDAEAMLHWDLATMMPRGGSEARAEQLATLRAMRHNLLTASEVGDWLAEAADTNGINDWQQANLREMQRMHAHAVALDEAQVDALSRATSACEATWREARAEADFARVLPNLRTLLGLVRETAEAKAEQLSLTPYDALLDEYEPDGRAAEIDELFADLAAFIPAFIAPVIERQATQPTPTEPEGPFPVDGQRRIAVQLMEALGFDFHHGRLDVSLHPFCGGTPDDVRITTRYDQSDFRSALMGVMHETGHALYQRNLPVAWRGQPVGDARGMVLHESQSLLIEMQVCRSREFLGFAAPLLRDELVGDRLTVDDPAWYAGNLYRHYTRVAPGLIRVDADEVTYPLHVILRYDLERAMLAGDLDPADLPNAWNDGMSRLLGLRPPNDRVGCLQDIHWYDGAWGYFPTYTLGALAAAQIFEAACADDAAIRPEMATGNFAPLVSWLARSIHGLGSRYSTRELLVRATGSPLAATAFKAHLRRRYLA